MDEKQAKIRMEKLAAEISKRRYEYHVLDRPDVTDEVYDSLMHELRQLEQEYPDLKAPDSPTQRVGGKPLEKFQKVRHQVRQWSFDDVFDYEELEKWEEKVKRMAGKTGPLEVRPLKGNSKAEQFRGRTSKTLEYVTEIKIDGLKIVLTYEKGILKQAATRGDGVIGEDVTENVKTIYSVPLRLKFPVDCIVVGECWLSKSELKRINKARKTRNEAEFANSRNAAAGSIRQLDPKIAASRRLDSFIYDLDYLDLSQSSTFPLLAESSARNSSKSNFFAPQTQMEELELLKKLGFKVNPHHKLCKSVDEIQKFYDSWVDKRNNEDYGIDGVVIKINSVEIQKALGYTGKAPRWGVAYKFPAERVTTLVENITVQVGRTGALTPVAHLRPVIVDGSKVSRATLHNEDEIRRLGIKIGDTVVIHKAGDVIPEVVEVIKNLRTGKEKEFKMPKKCPICGGGVARLAQGGKGGKKGMKVEELSAATYCLNPRCYAVEKEKIIHFVSKKGFNIDGLGEKIVEQLINVGLISNVADIFALKKGDLEPLERFADKSADNLISSIGKSKEIELSKFLYALGIRYVGEETGVLIERNLESIIQKSKIKNQNDKSKFKINDLRNIFSVFSHTSKENWMQIKGIGEKSAESLAEWFSDKENLRMLERMEKLGVRVEEVKGVKEEKVGVRGKTFVLTGELSGFTRDEAKDMIRKAGGDVSGSVSRKTDYLLVGSKPGSKYEKAKELGIKIIEEKEFKNLLGD